MNIAVVDDLAQERHAIIDLVKDYFLSRFDQLIITPSFTEFESGEDFLGNFKLGSYDLVLLDIYMSDLTGIETAEKLLLLDKKCKVIFFTSSTDHILDGYGVHALSYVLKPVLENCKSLYKALDYFVDLLDIDKSGINIQTDLSNQFVLHKNIVYIENSVRNLYFHFPSEVVQVYGKYSDFVEILVKDERFMECFRNLTVNMDYIDRPIDNDFLLITGEKVPISRRRKSEVLEIYTNYFIKRRCY